MTELCVEVRPRWPFRLPRFGGPDGVARVRGGTFTRLLHVDREPVLAWARQPARDRVVLTARAARRDAAEHAVERLRFALGVDDDLREFHERFRWDPLIGRAARSNPYLRTLRRPEPFEALAWAVCEQLIEFGRAAEIQRRIVRRLGRRCPRTGLRDVPEASRLAGTAPALLESLGLAGGRAVALVRVAREVAAGRIDLHCADHERGWRRLRTIPGIGRWTVEMLALHGQGRLDQVPAGDLKYLKLVGRMRTGNPLSRAGEDDVRELFARYHPWAGLAAAYLYSGRRGGWPAGAVAA
ncbi:MAG: DNA-3-methyladenine glycosylase family protein [Solirubrobacteraceae bacterium]